MKHEMCLKCSDNWKEQYYSMNSKVVCVFKTKKAVIFNSRTRNSFVTLPNVRLTKTVKSKVIIPIEKCKVFSVGQSDKLRNTNRWSVG